MKPEKTYCTLDMGEYNVIEIFSTKSTAEKFTAKRQRQWHSTINVLIRGKKPHRFYTMTLDEAINQIKEAVKEKYEPQQY